MITDRQSRALEAQATALLVENGVKLKPTNRSIRADGLIYLEAIAGQKASQLDTVIESEVQLAGIVAHDKKMKSLPSLLGVLLMTDEEQKVMVNYLFQDMTFRDLEQNLGTGGKSKYHMMYQIGSEKLKSSMTRIIPALRSIPVGILIRLEEEARKRVATNIVAA